MAKRVLVVDDHVAVRRAVCSLFRAEGFEVSDASNGAEAIKKAQQVAPDLIILDLAMPVMNGLDAARALRPLMPQTPLIMFTNTVLGAIKEEARRAGIAALVSKSESASGLLARAKELLQ